MRAKPLIAYVGATIIASISISALAQEAASSYPSRPVTIIIPFAPGGPVDRDTRVYVQKLRESIGQPFVVDYKPGAGSTIGTAFAARAKPDGYTLLSVTSSFSVNPALYTNLPFDSVRDIAPVSHMYSRGSMLVVTPTFPANTWPEYVAYVKANPGKVNFATSGAGGLHHIGGAWLHSEMKGKVTFVHYKGGGPAMLDVIAGNADALPPTIFTAIQQVKAGKLRVLAIMSAQRSALLPGVPTVAEQGLKGFDFSAWGGILTTGGTPAPIINKLSAEFAKITKSPEVLKLAKLDGTLMVGSTPEQFKQLISEEIARWKKVVKENNIRIGQQ